MHKNVINICNKKNTFCFMINNNRIYYRVVFFIIIMFIYSVWFSKPNSTSNILYNQGNFPIKIFCGTENKTKDKRAGGSFVQRKLNLKIGFMHLARYYKFFFSPSFSRSPLELFQCRWIFVCISFAFQHFRCVF